MKHLEQRIFFLFPSLIGASVLGWYINTYTPETWIYITIFFTLLGITLFFLFHFFLGHLQRSILFTIAILTILILRLVHLRHPIYSLLLIAFILSLEYSLEKRKKIH